MTNKEIEKAKQKLNEIMNKKCSNNERWNQLVTLAQEINAPVPTGFQQNPIDSINAINRNIHTVLQTEMMLNACVSAETSSDLAKRSCRWAAIAAIAACISVVLSGLTMCLTLCLK